MNSQYINVAGSFDCEVIPPEVGWFGQTEKNSADFIRVPVVVKSGNQNGLLATWIGWLHTDKALDNTTRRLKEVFGFDGDYAALHAGKITFAGMPCSITTEIETYEGKARCKVAWLNVPGGGAKPMDAEKVSSLLSKITSRGKAIAKATPSVVQLPLKHASAPANDPVPGDDDVPF